MNAFFFGLGFSSQASVDALREDPGTVVVAGTVRSLDKAQLLKSRGIDAHVFDGTTPSATLGSSLRASTHVIFSIAPSEAGDPALLHHRADLDAAPNLQWLCYYSTIGVYGDFG